MSIFKFAKVIVIFTLCLYLAFLIIDIKIYVRKAKKKNEDGKIDISEVTKQLYMISIPTFIFGIVFGITLYMSHMLQSGDLTEFCFNFNFATSHCYKELDRKELLTKAFDTILKEIDDEYTQSLQPDFKNYMEDGVETYSGYSLMILDKGKVVIDKIKDDSIKGMGLEENDEIISVNGISVKRNER